MTRAVVLPLLGCTHAAPGLKVWPTAERCGRDRVDGTKCAGLRTVWPTAHTDAPDPQSCWNHMSDEERAECNRGREACLGDDRLPHCGFCGKSSARVRRLIAGRTAHICDECVELCCEILKEELVGEKP